MRRHIFWFALIITVLLRVVYFHTGQTKYSNGTRIKIADNVLSEPIRYEFSQRISLQGFKFYLPHYPEIFYGDEIVVEGIVEDSELKSPKLIEVKEKKFKDY